MITGKRPMTYHFLETPDHLHRGLHLFGLANLSALLEFIATSRRTADFYRTRLRTHDHWLLSNVIEEQLLTSQRHRRWRATREARDFLKLHPEFRPREPMAGGLWIEGTEHIFTPREVFEVRREEDNEQALGGFEAIEDDPDLVQHIEELRRSILRRNASEVCDKIASLHESLTEHEFGLRVVLDLLSFLHDLLSHGCEPQARVLLDDAQESYEVTRYCNGEFRTLAKRRPNTIQTMDARQFEAFVGELLAQHGLQDIEITPIVADGGVDIVAYRIHDRKRLKYIVQCKRHAPTNRVRVTTVRELAGVKMQLSAAHALLVTTSSATAPAREFARQGRCQPWGVRIVDYRSLRRLLDLTD